MNKKVKLVKPPITREKCEAKFHIKYNKIQSANVDTRPCEVIIYLNQRFLEAFKNWIARVRECKC